MELLNEDSSSASNIEISKGIIEMQKRATAALKNIESIYKDVMGCDSYEEIPYDFEFEYLSEREDYCPNSSDSNLTTLESLSDNFCADKDILNSMIKKLCHKCRNIIVPPGTVYVPVKAQQNGAKNKKNLQCQNCNSRKSSHTLNTVNKIPVIEHPSSAASKKSSTSENKVTYRVKHRCALKVTIPEPFKMTIREAEKRPTKELKLHQLKEKLQESEKRELSKKIHSTPVPGHIYLPLFQNMVKNYERKKSERKEQTVARTKAIVKPFHFTETVGKKFTRASSVPDLTSKNSTFVFKAKPAPQKILSKEASEKIKNQETVRKMRIAERAKELLQQSSLPFSEKRQFHRSLSMLNLRSSVKTKEIKQPQQRTYDKITCNLSQEQCKRLMRDWNAKVSSMEKCDYKKSNSSNKNSVNKYDSKCKEFLASQAFPFYDLPVRMTTTTLLREQEVRKESEEKEKNQKLQEEARLEHTKCYKEAKKDWVSRLKANDPTLSKKEAIRAKLQQYRAESLLRQQEYDRELEEMLQRTREKPLLIERQYQKAKKATKNAAQNVRKPNSADYSSRTISDEESKTHDSKHSSSDNSNSCHSDGS